MKRIAFFVEGQTEQLFINKLLTEIANQNCLKIELFQLRGGASVPKRQIPIPQSVSYIEPSEPTHEIWIFDCGNDEKVKPDILENIHNLAASGFSEIIGIRDLFPSTISDLRRLEQVLKLIPPNLVPLPIPYTIIITVHEIEAWFLAECTHFQKIDNNLTISHITSNLGFNPCVDDMTQRFHPADDLKKIYQLVGKTYNKKKEIAERSVKCLDYANIYLNLPAKITKLNELISKIDAFLV